MTQGANSNDAKVDAISGAILTIVGFVLVVVFTIVIWTRALGFVAFPIRLVGGFLLYVGRQCTTRAKARRLFQGDRAPTQAVLQIDRAPVVYLRSFDQDSSFASGGSTEYKAREG